jgi:hypothetical protein
MKAMPSAGFVYLVGVTIGFVLFLLWAATPNWYDRIGTSLQTEDYLSGWASYLEKIASDYPSKKERIAFYEEAAELRSRLRQPEKAVADLKRASSMNPGDDSLKARILLETYTSGLSKEAAVVQARERFANGSRDWQTISILLADVAENPTSDSRGQLIAAVKKSKIPGKKTFGNGRIIMLGFTGDSWTHNGKPGFLIVTAPMDKEMVQEAIIGCYADSDQLPVTATISDGRKKIVHTFRRAENVRIFLPTIPRGEERLFVVDTNKPWVPAGEGKRRLGVALIING